MTSTTIVLIAALAAFLIAIVLVYNSLVSLRNKVNEAFSTMDVYLKKRYDLIPNLVAVVKGYAGHEASILENVTNMRTNAMGRGEQLTNESQITSALANIMAVVESYPELKADNQFLKLQNQLSQLEEDIAHSRRYYNGSVREFNNKCQTFPNNLIAGMFGFNSMPMFEAKSEERNNVRV